MACKSWFLINDCNEYILPIIKFVLETITVLLQGSGELKFDKGATLDSKREGMADLMYISTPIP